MFNIFIVLSFCKYWFLMGEGEMIIFILDLIIRFTAFFKINISIQIYTCRKLALDTLS